MSVEEHPCKYRKRPCRSGSIGCENCWEVARHINDMPYHVLARIFETVRPNIELIEHTVEHSNISGSSVDDIE